MDPNFLGYLEEIDSTRHNQELLYLLPKTEEIGTAFPNGDALPFPRLLGSSMEMGFSAAMQ